jgi:hypothetical protein
VDLDRLVGLADAAEPVDEVHVPGAAPELAVGRGPQARLGLHRDDLADRLVLGGAQVLVGEPAGRVVRPRRQQLRGSQQAADVVGTERGHVVDAQGDAPSGNGRPT